MLHNDFVRQITSENQASYKYLEGDLDLHGFLGLSDQVRPGYNNIGIKYRVKADAPREKIIELCDYVQKTSPVLDIIRNPVPVKVSLVD